MLEQHENLTQYELRWRAQRVAELMYRNNIHCRSELAEAAKIPKATTYTAFRKDWSGRATCGVLSRIAGQFSVRPDELVEVVAVP